MLIVEEQKKHYHLGVWKIEETKDELLSFFSCKEKVKECYAGIRSESKVLERLAVRVLLQTLLKKETDILYLNTGKPYLKDMGLNISISHTKGYVAVILTNLKYVGLDIQYITEKVKLIKPKFISGNEYIDSNNELHHLLLHWSAKETLYKAIGKGIDLKKSFLIDRFTPLEKGTFKAAELITGHYLSFDIEYKITSDYVVTYTLSE